MFDALFSAKGRMRRRDWWLWSIAVAIVVLISEVLMHRFFGSASFAEDVAFKGMPTNGFHYWLIFLATVGQWPTICLMAKRWHDRNRSGWLAAIWGVVLFLEAVLTHWGGNASGFAPQFVIGTVSAIVSFVWVIYGLWVLIDCGILDGTKGTNRYGPSPKGLGEQIEDVF